MTGMTAVFSTFYFIMESYLVASGCVTVYFIWLMNFLITALRNPGLPSTVIRDEDIIKVEKVQ